VFFDMGGDPFSDFHRGGGSQFNFGGGSRSGGSQFGGFPGGFGSQSRQGGQGHTHQRKSKK
jgi:hypothetical protein